MGRVMITPGALEEISSHELAAALARHQAGDWGDLEPLARCANEHALKAGLRLLSSYRTGSGRPFWIRTEGDRRSTVVMLPEDD